MNKQKIREELLKIVEEQTGVIVCENDNLKECGVDSLTLVGIVVGIEDSFGITFSDDDLQPDNLDTLGALIRLTERYI